MSITIFISSDTNCCLKEINHCDCMDSIVETYMPDCEQCGGTGKTIIRESPLTLTLSEEEFVNIWDLIQCPLYRSGQIHGGTFRNKLKQIKKIENKRDKNIFNNLMKISAVAEKREEFVVWC